MIMFCLLFSSCTKRNIPQQQKSIESVVNDDQDKHLDFIIQQEAMLVDIPIPLFDERIMLPSSFAEDGDLVFGYKSPLSYTQAIDFFSNQMERLGWKHIVSFEGVDIIMQFKSPDRYCTIVINKSESLSPSSIFIYLKKASVEACLK
jgi:hypothetical protein